MAGYIDARHFFWQFPIASLTEIEAQSGMPVKVKGVPAIVMRLDDKLDSVYEVETKKLDLGCSLAELGRWKRRSTAAATNGRNPVRRFQTCEGVAAHDPTVLFSKLATFVTRRR